MVNMVVNMAPSDAHQDAQQPLSDNILVINAVCESTCTDKHGLQHGQDLHVVYM